VAVSQVSTKNATFEYFPYFLEHCDSMYKLTRVSFSVIRGLSLT
jgi:hypothetical protein